MLWRRSPRRLFVSTQKTDGDNCGGASVLCFGQRRGDGRQMRFPAVAGHPSIVPAPIEAITGQPGGRLTTALAPKKVSGLRTLLLIRINGALWATKSSRARRAEKGAAWRMERIFVYANVQTVQPDTSSLGTGDFASPHLHDSPYSRESCKLVIGPIPEEAT